MTIEFQIEGKWNKAQDEAELYLNENALVKVISPNALLYKTFRDKRGKKEISDVCWYFYEEINEQGQPWSGIVQHKRDKPIGS